MQEHRSTAATRQHSTTSVHISESEKHGASHFLNLKYGPMKIHAVRLSEDQAMPWYRKKIRSPLMADRLMALDSIQNR